MDDLEAEYTELYREAPSMGEPFRGRVGLGFDIPDTIPEEEEIRKALRRMRNGKAPGPSKIRVEHLKDWADAYEAGMAAEVEGTAIPESVQERAMHWSLVVVLIQGIFQEGKVPAAFRNAVLVLIHPRQIQNTEA